MKKDLTLLVLAAGMGSRFGGMKQVEPIGPNGEYLIDYSIYDAIRAGFTKVVFLIKEEHLELFQNTIGNRISNHIKVEYAFQSLHQYTDYIPEGRVKPWGTAHAVLCAKEKIKEPFLMINSDDFYGKEAYLTAANYMQEEDSFFVVGYETEKTLSENGSVKRGVCIEKDGILEELIESKLEKKEEGLMAYPLSEAPAFKITKDSYVSMNMLGFTPKVFPYLEKEFQIFLKNMKDPMTSEYLIPDVLMKVKRDGISDVKLIKTSSKWFGMTYKSDTEKVKEEIEKLIQEGIYPNDLWK